MWHYRPFPSPHQAVVVDFPEEPEEPGVAQEEAAVAPFKVNLKKILEVVR